MESIVKHTDYRIFSEDVGVGLMIEMALNAGPGARVFVSKEAEEAWHDAQGEADEDGDKTDVEHESENNSDDSVGMAP
jgi:hypothetical protein